eukprot:4734506-Prorocentrum_lima.AAC.1
MSSLVREAIAGCLPLCPAPSCATPPGRDCEKLTRKRSLHPTGGLQAAAWPRCPPGHALP